MTPDPLAAARDYAAEAGRLLNEALDLARGGPGRDPDEAGAHDRMHRADLAMAAARRALALLTAGTTPPAYAAVVLRWPPHADRPHVAAVCAPYASHAEALSAAARVAATAGSDVVQACRVIWPGDEPR